MPRSFSGVAVPDDGFGTAISKFGNPFSVFGAFAIEATCKQYMLISGMNINYLAVLVAAISAFVIGGMWYSPIVFGNTWMRETGLSDDMLKRRSMGVVFGTSFVLSLIIAGNLAAFLAGPPDLKWGATAGALAGVGWVATGIGITYLFEAKSMKLFLIDAGYHAVTFVVMGAIIGIWK